jgi:hypothetical protein
MHNKFEVMHNKFEVMHSKFEVMHNIIDAQHIRCTTYDTYFFRGSSGGGGSCYGP